MRQVIPLLAVLALAAGCIPQLTGGGNALSVEVLDAKHVTVTFSDEADEIVTDLVLYMARTTGVLDTNQVITCEPIGNLGTRCTADTLTGPLLLTAWAIEPEEITVNAWWTTPTGDKAARARP